MPNVRLLRCHWAGFALLITLGLVSELLFSSGSPWEQYQYHARHYVFTAGHAALFGLLVAATYLNWKPLWGLAILVISVKLYRLLKYYAFFDYLSSSRVYNANYWVFFYKLGHLSSPWLVLPGDLLFSNNPVSAAFLTTLYVYWLVACREMLHAKPKEAG